MKTYVVGGAVRDELLDLPIADRDHVVVGATPQQMLDAGFKSVGRDFPVFLHPQSREEYALARTERKVAPGYTGFAFHSAPDVTLEQDLVRRDLTINAIAKADDGQLIDPYGGQADLRARILRHVGPAFVEDPVRILRLARFAARFTEFSVAPETLALMQRMVASGEVDALVAERVWQELSRGLMERQPSRMFALLQDCGALTRIMPELAPMSVPAMQAIDAAAAQPTPLAVRFTVLTLHMSAALQDGQRERINALAQRIRAPVDLRDLAMLANTERTNIAAAAMLPATALVRLLERCDALRKPRRFADLLAALSYLPLSNEDGSLRAAQTRLQIALSAAAAVDAGAIASSTSKTPANAKLPPATIGEQIKQAVRQARIAAVQQALP